MAPNKLLIALYLIGCIHHTFMAIYSLIGLDFSAVKDERVLDMKVNNFRYLTTWNMMLQSTYFYFALTIEIMNGIKNKHISRLVPIAKITKGTFFSGVMFPSTICVSTVFWTLHLINKEYMLPPGFEKVLPVWVNHGIHTLILYLVIVELALGQLYVPKLPITLTIAILYPVIYTIQYYALHYETGRWLYGVMYFLDPTQQTLFSAFINIYFIFLALIGLIIVKRKSNRFILNEQDKKKLCDKNKFS